MYSIFKDWGIYFFRIRKSINFTGDSDLSENEYRHNHQYKNARGNNDCLPIRIRRIDPFDCLITSLA